MKENKTMIIRKGKIYILQPIDDPLDDVCDTCDLRDMCMSDIRSLNLLVLCESVLDPDIAHFKEFKGKFGDLLKMM